MSTAEEPPPDEEARHAALKRQSDDHLQFAFKGGASAAAAAFQAGYCALLSALSAEELREFQDHPSASAAALSAERLQLTPAEQAQAEFGAGGYYAADQAAFRLLDDWLVWASRVRTARGWGL